MKKIGLCACYDTKNYGSMLQTLATCYALDILKYDYEIIIYTRKKTVGLILKSLGRVPEYFGTKMKKHKEASLLSKYPDIKAAISDRNQCFENFIASRFTKMSPTYDTYAELKKAALSYDAVLVGSDQLWRPEGYSTGFYNLMFVPDEIPKIAYATSFGVSNIPKRKIKSAKTFLSRIDSISVRELRGSEIVKELINRDVPTVVDPTLLFDGKEWRTLVEEKRIIKPGYIFCYYLGNNVEHRRAAEILKEKTGRRIVTIPHLDEFVETDIDFGDEQLYNVGPEEFVNIIRYADYICTDSFHGSVFSILNHKQFVTFNRFEEGSKNSRNSRIDSLLAQTGLESRHCKNCSTVDIKSILDDAIDYQAVDDRLCRLRKSSINYLCKSLERISDG